MYAITDSMLVNNKEDRYSYGMQLATYVASR